MHYKKHMLMGHQRTKDGGGSSGGQTSPVEAHEADKSAAPPPAPPSRIDAQGINLNQSLTDQLSRRHKDITQRRSSWDDHIRANGGGGSNTSEALSSSRASHNSNMHYSGGDVRAQEPLSVSGSPPRSHDVQHSHAVTKSKQSQPVNHTSSHSNSRHRPSDSVHRPSDTVHRSSDNMHRSSDNVSHGSNSRNHYEHNSSKIENYSREHDDRARLRHHDDRAREKSSSINSAQPPPQSQHSQHNNRDSVRGSGGDRSANERKASPLDFDKSKRVEPYRDPELLKRDELQRLAALHSAPRPPAPSVAQLAASAGAVSSALSGLATSRPSLLSGLGGYPSAAALSASAAAMGAGLPNALSLGHFTGPLDAAAVSSLSVLQRQAAVAQQLQQFQLLHSQQPHLMSYAALQSLQGSMQTRQLELLWQQKYQNIPVPPAWILHQYQEELLRDVNPLLQQRELQLDRDRREREFALQEREQQQQRERDEREQRERERERERHERERAERERQDRCVTSRVFFFALLHSKYFYNFINIQSTCTCIIVTSYVVQCTLFSYL